jgi:hypothetical protein
MALTSRTTREKEGKSEADFGSRGLYRKREPPVGLAAAAAAAVGGGAAMEGWGGCRRASPLNNDA